jgi:hypothetical protein
MLQMRNYINQLLFCLFIIITLPSCITESKFVRKSKMDTSRVPADFNPQKHILLIAEMPRLHRPDQTNHMVTRKLNNALKEKYPYKFEIVPVDEINSKSSKYADTSIYKYALLNSLHSVTHSTTTTTRFSDGRQTSVSPSAKVTSIDFRFFDRIEKKTYPLTGNSSTSINYTVAAFAALVNNAKSK